MPNIEIHGRGSDGESNNVLLQNISNLFRSKSYASEIVITVVYDKTYTFAGSPRPFIRLIISSNNFKSFPDMCEAEKSANEIEEKLKTLGMPVEVLELKR